MQEKNHKKIKKVLGKYNYWRQVLQLPSRPKRKLDGKPSSNCQLACHSDPCQADPTCDFS